MTDPKRSSTAPALKPDPTRRAAEDQGSDLPGHTPMAQTDNEMPDEKTTQDPGYTPQGRTDNA